MKKQHVDESQYVETNVSYNTTVSRATKSSTYDCTGDDHVAGVLLAPLPDLVEAAIARRVRDFNHFEDKLNL